MYRDIEIFNGVKEDNIPGVLGCIGGYEKEYKKSEFIIHAGDEVKSIGVMISGTANVIKEDIMGNRQIKAHIAKNEMFAESFVCARMTESPFSVIANTDARVLFLPLDKLLTTCSSGCSFHNRLIFNLVSILAGKNMQMSKKVDYVAGKTVRNKVARYLMDIYEMRENRTFAIPYNRNDLAEFLSVDRSVLSRELSKMKKEGIIDFDKNTFSLLDLSVMSDLSI